MHAFDDSPSPEEFDEKAIGELYERYCGLVCRIALYHLRLKGCNAPGDHSEEIIALAWLAILEHIGQLKHREKIESWMTTIIINLVHAHVSGPKGCISNQHYRVSLDAAEEARIEHSDKVCQNALLANEIRRQAYARSSTFGQVLRLFIEEDYTMKEVAEELGESPAKLRSMYYRYLEDLREFFKDDEDDEDDDSSEH